MMYLGGIFTTKDSFKHGSIISNLSKIPFKIKNGSWVVPRITIEEFLGDWENYGWNLDNKCSTIIYNNVKPYYDTECNVIGYGT